MKLRFKRGGFGFATFALHFFDQVERDFLAFLFDRFDKVAVPNDRRDTEGDPFQRFFVVQLFRKSQTANVRFRTGRRDASDVAINFRGAFLRTDLFKVRGQTHQNDGVAREVGDGKDRRFDFFLRSVRANQRGGQRFVHPRGRVIVAQRAFDQRDGGGRLRFRQRDDLFHRFEFERFASLIVVGGTGFRGFRREVGVPFRVQVDRSLRERAAGFRFFRGFRGNGEKTGFRSALRVAFEEVAQDGVVRAVGVIGFVGFRSAGGRDVHHTAHHAAHAAHHAVRPRRPTRQYLQR